MYRHIPPVDSTYCSQSLSSDINYNNNNINTGIIFLNSNNINYS